MRDVLLFAEYRHAIGFPRDPRYLRLTRGIQFHWGKIGSMASLFDQMTKINNPGGITSTRSKQAERRGSRRCKITQLIRIRPSDPERDPFHDIRGTLSASRSPAYFQTSASTYAAGRRLSVTLPSSQ